MQLETKSIVPKKIYIGAHLRSRPYTTAVEFSSHLSAIYTKISVIRNFFGGQKFAGYSKQLWQTGRCRITWIPREWKPALWGSQKQKNKCCGPHTGEVKIMQDFHRKEDTFYYNAVFPQLQQKSASNVFQIPIPW